MRQLLEVGEAAEAGAEVVEGEAAADLGQAVGERLACGDVLHQRRLGDLEDEVGGIGACLAHLPLDERQQVRTRDRRGGQVGLDDAAAAWRRGAPPG